MLLQTSVCESFERPCERAHYNLECAPDLEGVEVGEAEMIQELDRGGAPCSVCSISTVVASAAKM